MVCLQRVNLTNSYNNIVVDSTIILFILFVVKVSPGAEADRLGVKEGDQVDG